MRALTTTSSVLRVVCDTNADLDCHASSVDLTLSTGDVDEVIETSTVITTAGTTTVVAAPAAGATPPVTPTTAPRRWAIGSMRLITGRKVH